MTTTSNIVVLPQQTGAPLRVEEVVLPSLGPHHVLVQQAASGICHSQLHQMHTPRDSPVLLGHESVGVVVDTGSAVNHVKAGDTVLVTWVPRNQQVSKRSSDPIVIKLADGIATAPLFTWADYALADEKFVVKIPDDLGVDVASIIGCAVMTGAGAVINSADVKKGESVAIFGVGGVGLSAVLAAHLAGAYPIIAIDLDQGKLEMAKRFGATHMIDATECDAVAEIHALTPSTNALSVMEQPVTGVDYAFDCIGIRKTMEQLLPACCSGHFGVSRGGTGVLLGVPTTPVELDAMDIVSHEKNFIGSIGGSCQPERDFPIFLEWYRKGDLQLEDLVTARYRLEDINIATTALEKGQVMGRAILEFSH